MVSLFIINKRIVNIDMSCKELIEMQENIIDEDFNNISDSEEISPSEVELVLKADEHVNETCENIMFKISQSYTQKALNAYNINSYKSNRTHSSVIRNFENSQE